MRKKLITVIILLVALSFITIGMIEGQLDLVNGFYTQMSEFE